MMRRMLIVLCELVGVVLCAADVVKVSDYNPDPKDATKAIQAALDSGAKKVIIDKVGFDYLVERIDLRSNQEVVLEDGVVVAAIPGGHKVGNACMVLMSGIHDTILRGEGTAILRMNKKDYQNRALYTPSEHRHLMPIIACNNITIRDITIEGSGGDGIYISGDQRQWWTSNIYMENVISRDHHRQACSIISAEHLLFRNCKFLDTVGTPPACGIDLEPNNTLEKLTDCVIENCYFKGNAGGAFGAGIHQTLGEPISITFRDCVAEDNPGGSTGAYAGGSKDKLLSGYFEVINCKFRQPRGHALNFQNFRSGGLLFRFENCTIDMSGNPSPLAIFGTGFKEDLGDFDFGTLLVKRPKGAQPLFQIGALGAPKFCTPKGEILVEDENGTRVSEDLAAWTAKHPGNPLLREFDTLVCDTRGMVPLKKRGDAVNGLNLRGPQRFLLYGEEGKPIKILFEVTWHRNDPFKIPVVITDSDGNKEGELTLTEEKTEFVFTPSHTQVFAFAWETWWTIRVSTNAPGQGYDCSKRLGLMSCEQDFFFVVPEGAETVALELNSDAGEPASAIMYDENGKLVGQTEYNFGIQLLLLKRKKDQRNATIWRVHVKGQEDFGVRLGAPLEPILYTDPKNVLIRK